MIESGVGNKKTGGDHQTAYTYDKKLKIFNNTMYDHLNRGSQSSRG